ncbi:dynamin family protein [Moraxella sp. PS-22]|uniref:Dynamin family protein n=1 Tax=Moraxella tetraodonis TaxID=2767221 RepID=A0A9X2A0Y9_9GAMM|nr:dynamin family protein [Moraxella tetraodonis]MCG8147150.1 dynamin family protein [Moraxella tetraodonis]
MLETIDYQSRYEFICRAIAKDNDSQTISTTLNDSLNQLSKYLSKDLAELARRGSPDNFADIYAELQTEMVRFREFCEFPDLAQKVVIGIGGKFSAGKSTLINTLLGKKQLVTEIDPTTSLPTYLLLGNEAKVTALNLFNKKVELSMEEFQTLTHDEKKKYGSQIGSLFTSSFISDPEFNWQNIAILDTPGYTKPEDADYSERTDEKVARSQLNAAQFIIWLVSAEDGTIKEDDLQFLASLNADIPRLVLINKSDTKTPDDVVNIVALVKKTLADRNLPAVDVIPVSRKKRDYPIEPVLTWFDKWNEAPKEVTFAKNFKRKFRIYEQFLDSEERKAHMQLNRLNRILTLSKDEDISANAKELQNDVKSQLEYFTAIKNDLTALQQLFFDKLRQVGEQVGIAIPTLSAIEDFDFSGVNLLDLLVEVRESQGKQLIDYTHILRELTKPAVAKNVDLLLRRTSHNYFEIIHELTGAADSQTLDKLLRQDSNTKFFMNL